AFFPWNREYRLPVFRVHVRILLLKDHGVPIPADVFRRADSPPKLCFAPDSELPDQAESSQESSQCTARGEIRAEITGLTKLYGTGFGTAGAMLKMCGTFRIQSQVLEEDLCRPLHLPRVSCPRRQGVRRVGGSHARLPSFTVSSCSKSSS